MHLSPHSGGGGVYASQGGTISFVREQTNANGGIDDDADGIGGDEGADATRSAVVKRGKYDQIVRRSGSKERRPGERSDRAEMEETEEQERATERERAVERVLADTARSSGPLEWPSRKIDTSHLAGKVKVVAKVEMLVVCVAG